MRTCMCVSMRVRLCLCVCVRLAKERTMRERLWIFISAATQYSEGLGLFVFLSPALILRRYMPDDVATPSVIS